MSLDNDFEVAANYIGEHVTAIRDPQTVVAIEKWLMKLTSGETRSRNELNYLKLLQHMVADNRIGRPFTTAPPAGSLLPLSRYINPLPCCGRLKGEHARKYETWTSCDSSRFTQVDRDELDDDENCGEEEEPPVAANAGEEAGPRAAERDEVADGGSADKAKTVEADGHLSGGSESVRRDATVAKGRRGGITGIGGLCDPCLDCLTEGRRGKNSRPSKLNGTDPGYKNLLGDCALPTLTEAERKTVAPALLRVLENVTESTSLQDFYFQVSQCTCDRAALLMRVADGMINDFQAFVSDVFDSRAEHISDGLAKEQTAVSCKYAHLRDRTLNRATVALAYLRESAPVFNWTKYRADPEAHMRRAAAPPRRAGGGRAASGDGDEDEASAGTAADQAAAAAATGAAGEGVDEDEDDARQSANKKLLYSLNWLRTEVNRADCECQRLYEQRNGLTASLAEHNGKLSAAQCRSSGQVGRLKDELTVLRQKSADQSGTIDRLMEAIQLAMQNKPASAGVGGSC